MGSELTFQPDMWMPGVTLHSLPERLDEARETIRRCEDSLLALAALTPQHPRTDEDEDLHRSLPRKLAELLEEYREAVRQEMRCLLALSSLENISDGMERPDDLQGPLIERLVEIAKREHTLT